MRDAILRAGLAATVSIVSIAAHAADRHDHEAARVLPRHMMPIGLGMKSGAIILPPGLLHSAVAKSDAGTVLQASSAPPASSSSASPPIAPTGAAIPATPFLPADSGSSNATLPNATLGHAGVPMPPVPQDDPEFNAAAVKALGGMTPDQVKRYRKMLDRMNKVESEPASGVAPRLMPSRRIIYSLQIGTAPPEIRFAANNATALAFADSTGAPWPVLTATVGNPDAYKPITASGQGSQNSVETNMVILSPLRQYAQGSNLIVMLKGLPIPLVFNLVTGLPEVDSRVEVRVPKRGPNAPIVQASGSGGSLLAPPNDATVQAFVDGTPPHGARLLRTSNGIVEAWSYQGMMYVRTPLTLLAPMAVGQADGDLSGQHVYTLEPASVLTLAHDGRMASVTVDGVGP